MIRKQVKQITMRRGRYDWKGEMDLLGILKCLYCLLTGRKGGSSEKN